MLARRKPSYEESVKTIKRSIQARGGIAPHSRVLEALVWNYYKHLLAAEKCKLEVYPPPAWDAAGWIRFRQDMAASGLRPLVEIADDMLCRALDEGVIKTTEITGPDGRVSNLYVLPNTKVSIGA